MPCNYFKYLPAQVIKKTNEIFGCASCTNFQEMGNYDNKFTGFSFGFPTAEMTVKEEAELYPLNSFVAEVGGALGLFFGFSFIGLWKSLLSIINFIINLKKNRLK